MKMKKLFRSILSIVIAVCMLIPTGTILFAEEPATWLYITTTECPQGAIEYAQENLANFFVGYAEYTPDIKLGSPFTLSSTEPGTCTLYYFPVIKNNEIIFTLRVYEAVQNEFAGILSPALASELTALMQETSENQPARILVNNGNVVSIVGSDIDVIAADPMGGVIDYNEIAQTPAVMTAEVQNCMEVIPHEPQSEPISTYAAYPGTYDLTAAILEQQSGDEQWCSAYVLAYILNYRRRTTMHSAKTIMRYYYPNPSDDELKTKRLTIANVKEYAMRNEITLEPVTLPNESYIKEYIYSGKPMFIACKNLSNNDGHAMVIKGYSSVVFFVWNPLKAYYESMPISTMQYSTTYVDNNLVRYAIDFCLV